MSTSSYKMGAKEINVVLNRDNSNQEEWHDSIIHTSVLSEKEHAQVPIPAIQR